MENYLMYSFNQEIVSPCYKLLNNQYKSKLGEQIAKVKQGLRNLNTLLKEQQISKDEPFYMGKQFSIFEVITAPFIESFRHTLKYYRGFDMFNTLDLNVTSLSTWFYAVLQRPSFQLLKKESDYYIQGYQGVLEYPSQIERPVIQENTLAIFANPMCPFAHRGMMAATFKLGSHGFRVININLGEEKPPWYGEIYDKLSVPALQYGDYTMGDSIPCIKWMDKTFSNQGPQLFLSDDQKQQELDEYVDEYMKKVVFPCYKFLNNQDPTKDFEKGMNVFDGLNWFDDLLEKRGVTNPNTYFANGFGLFEILTSSFLDRFRYTLDHYRGFKIYKEKWKHILIWMDGVESTPAFQETCRSKDFYIKSYSSYGKSYRYWLNHAINLHSLSNLNYREFYASKNIEVQLETIVKKENEKENEIE